MRWVSTIIVAGLAASAASGQVVYSGSGASAASIQTTVDQFRSDLGVLNPNVAGSFGSGRREINWDGVPDSFAAPNSLPADFFNVNSPRGLVLSTGGPGFQVSADSSNPTMTPTRFDNIAAGMSSQFAPFSAERLFTSLGATSYEVHFFIPGSATPALSRGFGAVFCDVDSEDISKIECYDASDALIFSGFVPAITGQQTFSFLGVSFSDAMIARVRVTAGSAALGSGGVEGFPNVDLVVLDDFVFGEPVPAPGAGVVLGLAGLAALNRRRKR